MKIPLLALFWGCVSAVSLPFGALIGLWSKPSKKFTSALMAFGGGALLFALTIELFAHSLRISREGDDLWIILATMIGAILGGFLFVALNQMLNNMGAFLRKGSLMKKHIIRFKHRKAKKMIEMLSRIKLLQILPPEEITSLIPLAKTKNFSEGEVIFKQGDVADRLYFIISGKVHVLWEEQGAVEAIAELDEGDIFGEIALVADQSYTATIKAVTDVSVWMISKSDFEHHLHYSSNLKEAYDLMAGEGRQQLQEKTDSTKEARQWGKKAIEHLKHLSMSVTEYDIKAKVVEHKGGSAARAIWLGIALDGIPESLVIGMLVVAAAAAGTSVSLAFVVGVFLANLPEAISSSVTMHQQGSKFGKIFWMWMSLCIMTGMGALVGALIFPANPGGSLRYFISGIEGLAAGAMLTMIAETMLPEAFEQGSGTIVGLFTLAGFLTALAVKLTG